MTIKLFTNHTHVTLMLPSFQPLSEYLHLVTPSLTLPPASGDEGEFVALPPFIQGPVAVVESLMAQTVCPSFTWRNLVSPSTFLKIPLCIRLEVAVVELWMVQAVDPSATIRNLVSPSTFLKTGRPSLHLPSSTLLLESPINSLYLKIFGWW